MYNVWIIKSENIQFKFVKYLRFSSGFFFCVCDYKDVERPQLETEYGFIRVFQ